MGFDKLNLLRADIELAEMRFDKLNELPLNGYRGDYRDQNKKTLTH
jgi:hypothetical protein